MTAIKIIFLWFLTLLLASCSFNQINTNNKEIKIYAINNGWHTGIVVPFEALNNKLPKLNERFALSKYYEIGWGDNGFYQATEITAGLALQAMFASKGSLLHFVAFDEQVEDYFQNVEKFAVNITKNDLNSLLNYIVASMQVDKNGEIIPVKKGIYGDSQFYLGKEKYSLFFTCNNWAATALQQANLNINPTFKMTSGSIMRFLNNNYVNQMDE